MERRRERKRTSAREGRQKPSTKCLSCLSLVVVDDNDFQVKTDSTMHGIRGAVAVYTLATKRKAATNTADDGERAKGKSRKREKRKREGKRERMGRREYYIGEMRACVRAVRVSVQLEWSINKFTWRGNSPRPIIASHSKKQKRIE